MNSNHPGKQSSQLAREEQPDGSDLIDETFDLQPPERNLKIKKRRLPWHRPRKHYCRIHLWCQNIARLIRDLNLKSGTGSRPLRYLSLPGDELLDIRTVHGVCESNGIPLEFLGFNTASNEPRRTEADISWSEVRNLKFVSEEASRVLMLSLEDVSKQDSMAYQSVLSHGPFHVINLDLCGSIANSPPRKLGSTLEALNRLIFLQRRKIAEPWLQFLATRIGTDTVDRMTAQLLLSQISANAKDSRFAERFDELFPYGVSGVDNHIQDTKCLDSEEAISALSVGIAKWLLGVCSSEGDRWHVELVGCYGYRVHQQPKDMMSFGFRMSRIGPSTIDPTGITVGTTGEPGISEVVQAINFLAPLSRIEDVDQLLASNKSLNEQTVRQSQRLLASARHDEDDYLEWLKSNGDYP